MRPRIRQITTETLASAAGQTPQGDGDCSACGLGWIAQRLCGGGARSASAWRCATDHHASRTFRGELNRKSAAAPAAREEADCAGADQAERRGFGLDGDVPVLQKHAATLDL